MTFDHAFAALSLLIGGTFALLELSLRRKLQAQLAQLGPHILESVAFFEQHGLLELARDHAGRVVGIARSPFSREMEEELALYLLDPIESVEPLSNKCLKLAARVD